MPAASALRAVSYERGTPVPTSRLDHRTTAPPQGGKQPLLRDAMHTHARTRGAVSLMCEDRVRDGPASGGKGSKGESYTGGNPLTSCERRGGSGPRRAERALLDRGVDLRRALRQHVHRCRLAHWAPLGRDAARRGRGARRQRGAVAAVGRGRRQRVVLHLRRHRPPREREPRAPAPLRRLLVGLLPVPPPLRPRLLAPLRRRDAQRGMVPVGGGRRGARRTVGRSRGVA
mmetsp:Transcript_42292/g.96338  ORF Transcript_42292/g.96338 Transcript_42292/m.96338 type:complete len:230 (-) Transcript_42292:1062-1751(-)